MGMYTHLCLNAELGASTPGHVVETLRSMVDGNGRNIAESQHPLFVTERWHWMLNSGGSYYFPAHSKTTLRFDEISKTFKLTVNTNIKNYGDEWQKFLSWLTPHLERAEGYYRYEESEAVTPLLFAEGGWVQGLAGVEP